MKPEAHVHAECVSNNTVHMIGDMTVHFAPSDETITPAFRPGSGRLVSLSQIKSLDVTGAPICKVITD